MSEQWFWRTGSEIRGPYSAAAVKRFEAEGKLGSGDFLRYGSNGDWQPALEVVKRLPTSHAVADFGSASDAAAQVLANSRRAGFRQASGAEAVPQSPFVRTILFLRSMFVAVGDRFGSLAGFLADRLFSRAGQFASLVVVLALLAAVLLRLTGVSDNTIADAHSEYLNLWGEIRELRARSAAQQEWDALQQDADERLPSLVARLEEVQKSNATNATYWLRSSQVRANLRAELIAVGKTSIPAIVRSGRGAESRHETQLGKTMDRVNLYLDGREPYAPLKAKGGPADKQIAEKIAQQKFDYASVAVAGIDMLLIAGGVAWWVKRRKA